jgi:2'-5' RNA ligase
MKTGIVVMAAISGPVAERLRKVQEQYDPRMAAELPPHITLSGSSGMGPIPNATTIDALQAALDPIAAATAPFVVRFAAPMKFMKSNVVVLPIDPNGPIRALHERIKASGLRYGAPRFTFTPHCTLSFYPELPRERLRELLALRFDEPVTIDSLQAYRADLSGRPLLLLSFPLGGPPDR